MRICFSLLITWFMAVLAQAQTSSVTLQQGVEEFSGTSDTSIYADRPNNGNGGGVHLFSGATLSSVRRVLIRFDLDILPEGITAQEAELRLTVNRSGPSSTDDDMHTLHRVTQAWGEGNADAGEPGGNGTAAGDGAATWNASMRNLTEWANPGGDFAEDPSGMAAFSRDEQARVSISGPGMADDINDWLVNPDTNHGWILIGAEDGNRNARRFDSSESGNEPPALFISFTVDTSVKQWQLY